MSLATNSAFNTTEKSDKRYALTAFPSVVAKHQRARVPFTRFVARYRFKSRGYHLDSHMELPTLSSQVQRLSNAPLLTIRIRRLYLVL